MDKKETIWLVSLCALLLVGVIIWFTLAVIPAMGAETDNLTQFDDTWALREYVADSPAYFSGYSLEDHNCVFIAGDLYQPAQTDNVPIKIIWDVPANHWANIAIVEPMDVWYVEAYTAHVKEKLILPGWIIERWQKQNDFMGVIWRHGKDWNIWTIFIETPKGFMEIDRHGNMNPALGWHNYKFEWRTTPNL